MLIDHRPSRTLWLLGTLATATLIAALCFFLPKVGLVFEEARPAIVVATVYLFGLLLFLLPGFALATKLAPRLCINPMQLVILTIVAGATLGYLSFWAYFFGRWPGKILFYSTYITSTGALLWEARNKDALQQTIKRIGFPFLYTALAGLFYLSLFSLFVNPGKADADYADSRFFKDGRPGDNLIPYIVAERVYYRQPLQAPILGDWRTSDRPPLQSGIVLLERPFQLIKGNNQLTYQLLSIGMQCLWVAAVWCLLYSLGTSPPLIRRALGLFLFSGFFFYNSVYTWPKMLAASFILFVVSILVGVVRAGRSISTFETALASMSLGLALVAHPGSVFSLCGFCLVIFYFRRFFFVRNLWLSALMLAAYVLPWSAYQKFVDPPGNRLAKMHFAGISEVDVRSFGQALHDGYTRFSPREIVSYKWSNIKLLAGHKPLDDFGLNAIETGGGIHINREATEKSRIAQREWIWNAVGVMNAGWFAIPLLLLRRWRQKNIPIPFSGWLVAAALCNFLVWSLALFGPHATKTTHSSYADILFLAVGLCGFLLTLSKAAYLAVLALQIFNLWIVWVWSPPYFLSASNPTYTPVLQLPLLLAAILLGAVILWVSLSSFTTKT